MVMGVILLAGCGPSAATPTPQPALAPIRPGPTARPGAPAPTIAAQGVALPGRLLFVQAGNLWLWQGDAGRQISAGGDAFQPAWSPDGGRIAYVRRVQSYSDVMVMPAGGGEPQRLTENGPDGSVYSYERIYLSIWALYPAWSRDGATIAFASQAGPPSGSPAGEYSIALFTMPAGGGERSQLYAEEGAHVGRVAYAPDGDSIVFAYEPSDEGAPTLYRYSRASASAAPLPGAIAQSYDPVFSADGRWLAFAARDGGRTDVFAMPSGGGPVARLTSLGAARAPAFSSDGKLLAFLAVAPGSNSFDLWVADIQAGADGALLAGEPRQVTHDMKLDADSGIAWGR